MLHDCYLERLKVVVYIIFDDRRNIVFFQVPLFNTSCGTLAFSGLVAFLISRVALFLSLFSPFPPVRLISPGKKTKEIGIVPQELGRVPQQECHKRYQHKS